LEYEWRDITEYNGESCVFCPVCGLSITVPETIEANPYADLHSCTIGGIVGDLEAYKLQAPYTVFARDALCASNKTACSDHASALSSLTIEAKDDDACTLTTTI
jgi:hypothetical protein